jgi:hypothetical protein
MPLKKVWDNLAGNWDLHPSEFETLVNRVVRLTLTHS